MAEEGTTATTTTRNFLWTVRVIEAVMTFVTFVICASFPGSYKAEYKLKFLIFVAITAFIFVVLHIILRMPYLFEKLPPVMRRPILDLAGCFLAALALLIGSAVVFAKGDENNFQTLEASGACGFVSAALFFIEGVYFVILYRRSLRRQAEEKTTEEIKVNDFVQPSKPEY